MRRIAFFAIILFLLSLKLLLPTYLFAATDYQNCMITSGNPDSDCQCSPGNPNGLPISCVFAPAQFFDDPTSIVNILLPNLILIAGIILFLLVVFAGFQMVASGGDPAKMEKWRNMLMYGVIGFVVVLFAFVAIQLVEFFTGANILNPEEVLNP